MENNKQSSVKENNTVREEEKQATEAKRKVEKSGDPGRTPGTAEGDRESQLKKERKGEA